MKNSVKVGCMVGAISGVAAIVVYYLLCFLLDVTFEKITPVSIFLMSVVVNIVGALIYAKLKKRSARPRWMYAFITIGVALALSLFDWAFPAEPGIAGVANTLHGFVATLSIAWLPGWMDRTVSRTKS
ncbi:DUF6069 family protein [Rossellomorea sp. LjRoot5]|uniref:DUF6069 family protein n=1 Tax=Rossellomorea sp. LjRoot5 TaxID=3342331 RepID=UPI003ED05D04